MTTEPAMGRRERNNRRTQLAIVRAMTELTLEGGYAAATIPRISERADVSPRTVSTWFPSKDDIVFAMVDGLIERATAHLRGTDGSFVDRLEAWIAEEGEREPTDPELGRLRYQAIRHDPELRARDRQHLERIQDEVAAAAGRELGLAPTDPAPVMVAGATMALLDQARLDVEAEAEDVLETLTAGFAVLRTILSAVRG